MIIVIRLSIWKEFSLWKVFFSNFFLTADTIVYVFTNEI